MSKKVGRNDPCPCGSGKKYKQCCQKKQQAQPAKTYTAAGKRKFKAKVLSSGEGPSLLQKAGTSEGIKFNLTEVNYQAKEQKKGKIAASKMPKVKPQPPKEATKSLEEGFEPTQEDYQKEQQD